MYQYPITANRITTKVGKYPQTLQNQYNQTPPPLGLWNKIETLYEKTHHLVYWELIHLTTKKSPRPIQTWLTRIAPRQLPTSTIMGERSVFPPDKLPRGYGHITEDKYHTIQCNKGDNKWDKLQKTIIEQGERNISAPQIISAILHIISTWCKGQMPSTPPPPSLAVSKAFENLTKIRWLQNLMGITSSSWSKIQNRHLQLLRAKTTGKR